MATARSAITTMPGTTNAGRGARKAVDATARVARSDRDRVTEKRWRRMATAESMDSTMPGTADAGSGGGTAVDATARVARSDRDRVNRERRGAAGSRVPRGVVELEEAGVGGGF
jgi:hypothetical protein